MNKQNIKKYMYKVSSGVPTKRRQSRVKKTVSRKSAGVRQLQRAGN